MGPYAVVISDMRTPQMDGAQSLAKVHDLSPTTVRLALTGYLDIDTALAAVNEVQHKGTLLPPIAPLMSMETSTGPCTLFLSKLIICRSLWTTMDFSALKYGRRGGNRTHNPRLRRPVLYPIELLAHVFIVAAN
jgi:CheY-like chemotaxis protein